MSPFLCCPSVPSLPLQPQQRRDEKRQSGNYTVRSRRGNPRRGRNERSYAFAEVVKLEPKEIDLDWWSSANVWPPPEDAMSLRRQTTTRPPPPPPPPEKRERDQWRGERPYSKRKQRRSYKSVGGEDTRRKRPRRSGVHMGKGRGKRRREKARFPGWKKGRARESVPFRPPFYLRSNEVVSISFLLLPPLFPERKRLNLTFLKWRQWFNPPDPQ